MTINYFEAMRYVYSIIAGLFLFPCLSCSTDTAEWLDEEKPIDAVPVKGMKLVWNDEFNRTELDADKWFTQYYSTLDFVTKTKWEQFQSGILPEPAYKFTGNSIVLYIDEKKPEKAYWESSGRKISSIQTYDWRLNKNLLGDKVGGYIEARIRRNATEGAQLVNTAFWFDSPGPDAKYFIEEGNTAKNTIGVRPRGQVFEIDMCEYLNTEIVLHGNVNSKGEYEYSIGKYLVNDVNFKNRWTTHALLWTPNSLKFYIDGILKKEWSDPNDIKSSNHYMNIYFGAYGKGGTVSTEVDYIRFYQWDLEEGNELPNGNFEYGDGLYPWEGDAQIDKNNVKDGKQALSIASGKQISQYVYVDHTSSYCLEYWSSGCLETKVENIIPVVGNVQDTFQKETNFDSYTKETIVFSSKEEVGINKATVKVTFRNKGNSPVLVDHVVLKKGLR